MIPIPGRKGAFLLETEEEARIALQLVRGLPPGEASQVPSRRDNIIPELKRRLAALPSAKP